MAHTLEELVVGSVPVVVEETRGFWEGTLAGELRLQTCGACGHRQYPGAAACGRCLAQTLNWTPSAGKGSVYAFTIVRRALHPSFAQDIPYVVADVTLDEGPVVTSNVVDAAPEEVAIGMRVEVVFGDEIEDAFHTKLRLPKFRPLQKG